MGTKGDVDDVGRSAALPPAMRHVATLMTIMIKAREEQLIPYSMRGAFRRFSICKTPPNQNELKQKLYAQLSFR